MIDWEREAKKFGFASGKEMLEYWYGTLKLPSSRIASRIGTTGSTVLRQLKRLRIKVKGRGGWNHSRWRK